MTKPDLSNPITAALERFGSALLARIERLEAEVAELRDEQNLPAPLPAWVDEPLYTPPRRGFDFGDPNINLPIFNGAMLTVRCENALVNNASHLTTRQLIALPHRDVLRWKNFGKVSLHELVAAIEKHGVQWPVRGRQ